jgi:hypothetical protein
MDDIVLFKKRRVLEREKTEKKRRVLAAVGTAASDGHTDAWSIFLPF